MLRRPLFAAHLVVLTWCLATAAMAQTTNGVITGTVKDAQEAVLPGVTVTAHNVDTGAVRTGTSETDGHFRLAGLLPGRYELLVELQGFGTVTIPNVTVVVGSETTQNVTMQVQGLQESVTVTAEAPVIAVASSDVSGIITQEQMATLPLATRSPMDLALLLPGTSQDAVRPRRSNANLGGAGVTFGAALLVDGVWNKESIANEPRQDFPQSAIQEFKVYVSQSPAEYGWTAGGAVSMATKSGTNAFHGEVLEFYRNRAMNTLDPFVEAAGGTKPKFSRHQYGGALGGPIIQDKAHFFMAAEGLKNNLYPSVVVRLPQFYGSQNGVFPSPEYNHMTFTRGDVRLTQSQTVFARYAWQISDYTCDLCAQAGSFSNAWFSGGGGIKNKRYASAGAHTWVLSNRVVNEVRVQYTNNHFRQHPPGAEPAEDMYKESPERFAPTTSTYAFPSFSWGSNSIPYSFQMARQIRDDFTISTVKHTWKFGGDFQNMPTMRDDRRSKGGWTFSLDQPFDPRNLASFVPLPGSVRQFSSGSLNDSPLYQPNALGTLYAQDEWRPVSGLTLNLGLRYDYQFSVFDQRLTFQSKDPRFDTVLFPTTGTPTSLEPLLHFDKRGDKNNFGPRIGMAWDVRNDSRTVVRADYGIYYNPMSLINTAGERQNYRLQSVIITNPTYPDPYGGRDPLTFLSTAPQNIGILSDDIENLQSDAYTAGFSHALGSNMALHVDGVYNKLRKAPMNIDINPRSGGTTGNRPLPQFGRILQYQSIGFMDYKALLVRLDKRLDRNFMYTISYTLAKSDGNLNNSGNGGLQATIVDSARPDYDIGPNNSDRRHALVASGTVLIPGGVTVGGIFTYRSVMPFGAQAGIDINGDGNTTDYVPGTTRNVFNRGNDGAMLSAVNAWRAANGLAAISPTLGTNEFYSVDLRASKTFALTSAQRIELIAQVFNVFNRTNLLAQWQTNALSSTFGTVSSAAPKRQAELAARFTF